MSKVHEEAFENIEVQDPEGCCTAEVPEPLSIFVAVMSVPSNNILLAPVRIGHEMDFFAVGHSRQGLSSALATSIAR